MYPELISKIFKNDYFDFVVKWIDERGDLSLD